MSTNIKELSLLTQDLKLLYVEDDKSAREQTLKLLENFFKNVTIAVDGQEGVEKFREEKFDLILSDINMPRLNGLEMLRIIRKEDPNMPVLLLSAHDDSEYFLSAIELDVDGYVLKPLKYKQFLNELRKIAKKISAFNISENYQKCLEEEVLKVKDEVERKLYFDPLTNLLSRHSFFRDLNELRSPMVLLVDIDKFKVINEVYGSDVGSRVLEKFALYLSLAVEDESCRVYRLSADEFAIVDTTKHIDPEKYERLIEELFNRLNNLKLKVGHNVITVDISIGLSSVEEHAYESAKIALDYAKKHKKPFVTYSSAIDHRKESGLTLKCRDEIVLAIEEKRVVAVYQPIVGKSGEIVKHETLMRLRSSDGVKLITPFHFLDVAIKTRLYEHLSSTIIFSALERISATDETLSVNFTYSDIKNRPFLKRIEDFIISRKGVGDRVVFEITESESIENYDEVKSFIKRFRKHGVKMAIDDFGSGFSNFEYILEIEPDYLKIDGSLIKNIDKNPKSFTLVKAIVQFSHKLGIKVIAEFVHSEVIFEMLKELDVDEYQGYYFSEALEK